MWQIPRLLGAFGLLLTLVAAGMTPARARVVRIEIDTRTEVLHGKSFGEAGPYQRLTGQIFYSVRVDNPHNAAIVDLRNAVNLRDGEVEFSADFVAFQPKDPHK